MRVLRLVNLISLVLVLVAGSVAMASARHQMRASGEVVICTGYGLTTIVLDADGTPVESLPILCPDCVPGLAALTDPMVILSETPGTLTPVRYARIDLPMPKPEAPGLRRSRAPPVAV